MGTIRPEKPMSDNRHKLHPIKTPDVGPVCDNEDFLDLGFGIAIDFLILRWANCFVIYVGLRRIQKKALNMIYILAAALIG